MTPRAFFARVIAIFLFLVGIGQLAISQVHVAAATKVFANQIGIYMFIFIIFGLTTGFNAVLVEKPRSLFLLMLSGVLAAWGGFVYLQLLQADVARQDQLTMADVEQSFRMVGFSIFVYLIGSIVVTILRWPEAKAVAANG